MPDITMCYGKDCPLKEKCYRFTAKASIFQYYFTDSPYKDKNCDYFWDDEKRTERRNKRKS